MNGNGESAFAALATSEGSSLLEALEAFDEEHAAAAAQRARSLAAPDIASAALATSFARRRAARSGKFANAGSMLFTRAGYEQATSSAVARHRAQRFAGLGLVYDLCCGIGSDTVAIAQRAARVIGVDIDVDALACATSNARMLGAGNVAFEQADVLATPLDGADAAFADPSRRRGASRVTSPGDYAPPLREMLARARELPGGRLCVKVAPGIDVADPTVAASLGELPLEVEFVSENGTCKEAALWCGAFARSNGARRAAVIAGDRTHTLDGDLSTTPAVSSILASVGEVDAAVIRAGLIGALCAERGWSVLDRRVAYVTADAPQADAFARWYRVRDIMPFNVKNVRAYLRDRTVGKVTIKTRAFPLKPDEIDALLKPRGEESATMICTTFGQKKMAIICDPY